MAKPAHDLGLPKRPVERLTRPFERFLHIEAAAGVALLAATLVALAVANSPLQQAYERWRELPVRIGAGSFILDYPLWYWINDGLMALFFFVIGLEIKRELVWGELRDRRTVTLPLAGAIGGAAVPVAVYLTLSPPGPERMGWAIPMATDIAFVVGCLALLGKRVPLGLKVLVLSLAIIDDIFAVLVIAAFFTAKLSFVWLVGAVAGFGVVVLLNRVGVRQVGIYVLVGAVIWLCTLKSGVHPTVAGALLGLLTPASAWLGKASVTEVIEKGLTALHRQDAETEQREYLEQMAFATREATPPLDRLERALHPWVGFAIMPVFALANAGVPISASDLREPIVFAVAAGLLFGKPAGILLACWLAVRAGWARLPEGVSWGVLFATGCLAGIGFTMALFIASLSLESTLLDAAKTGIMLASALSMGLGLGILWLQLGKGK